MREKREAEANPSVGIGPRTPWRVVSVQPLTGLRLSVSFADGTRGEVDLSRLVVSRDAGIFECLRNPVVFAQVGIEHGAVTWPGDIDLAPDAMYDEIKARGHWTPE
jgi:hypothetical protein